jgi:hypothetical protein
VEGDKSKRRILKGRRRWYNRSVIAFPLPVEVYFFYIDQMMLVAAALVRILVHCLKSCNNCVNASIVGRLLDKEFGVVRRRHEEIPEHSQMEDKTRTATRLGHQKLILSIPIAALGQILLQCEDVPSKND